MLDVFGLAALLFLLLVLIRKLRRPITFAYKIGPVRAKGG